jgi:putative acetyltransferase
MSSANLTVAPEPFDSADSRRLIAALDAELGALYPPEQRFGPNFKAAQIADGRGAFLIARDGDLAVGCGAIRVLDATTAEVKRMYVDGDRRGTGAGWAILESLEATARRMGVRRLVLETGVHQHAAIALYLRAGFTQVDCWGEYAASPTSVCYEKNLDR